MIRNLVTGVFFLLGALAQLGAEEKILEIIDEKVGDYTDKKDNPKLRILSHQRSVLLKYLRTLLFLPVFNMKRPIELDDYEGETLGILASPLDDKKVGRYRSTDRFLRELTKLEPGHLMSVRLAAIYCKAFYSKELEDGMRVFIDGHFKVVWTLKNIPRGKHGMMNKVVTGLKQIFLMGPRGHPLLHSTHPGDESLKNHILPHIEELERAMGKQVVNVVVVDNEGCSEEIFETFKKTNHRRKKEVYLITKVRDNQFQLSKDFKVRMTSGNRIVYRPLKKSDFRPYQKDRKGRLVSKVALAEFNYLSNKNRRGKKGKLMVRCAVVKEVRKVRKDKITVIVTDAPWEMIPSGKSLARWYFDRWPCQEGIFKLMKELCNLNTNHGYRKEKVPNRMAKRKLKKASKTLKRDQKRLVNLEKKLHKLEQLISTDKGKGIRAFRRRVTREILLEKKKHLLKKIEKDQKEVTKWEDRLANEPFYEIRTEMDHVMSNLKVLLMNMFMYTHEKFFDGGPPDGLELLRRVFIEHQGNLEILEHKNGDITYRFILNSFDDRKYRRIARKACKRFNQMDITTTEGINLEMAVKKR